MDELALFDEADTMPAFRPNPDRTPRDLTVTPAAIEPVGGGRWRAFIPGTRARVLGLTPHDALQMLLNQPVPSVLIEPGPSACQVCAAPNALLAYSPKGSGTFAWYCGTGTPNAMCNPIRKPRPRP